MGPLEAPCHRLTFTPLTPRPRVSGSDFVLTVSGLPLATRRPTRPRVDSARPRSRRSCRFHRSSRAGARAGPLAGARRARATLSRRGRRAPSGPHAPASRATRPAGLVAAFLRPTGGHPIARPAVVSGLRKPGTSRVSVHRKMRTYSRAGLAAREPVDPRICSRTGQALPACRASGALAEPHLPGRLRPGSPRARPRGGGPADATRGPRRLGTRIAFTRCHE